MATDRRVFVQGAAASALGLALLPRYALAQQGQPASAETVSFSFDWLVGEAERLASLDYESGSDDVPEDVANMTYDQYRDIRFKTQAAIWADQPVQFRLDLLHLGFVYKEPVQIALVEDGKVREIPFAPDLFTYGPLVEPPERPEGLGFSGFRARYPINSPDLFDEFVVFQGASYFRAVARNQLYGLSARGLAINTAEPEGEEFPSFRRYWIERPSGETDKLVVYALLDSPSVTGAYRFQATPGAETVIDVDASIFARREVKKIGLAPLTSMFLFNGINRAAFDDYRHAVHDSDGLQMLSGAGEWIWRPLCNPRDLQVSDFSDQAPRGFGLIQRARRYGDFEDAEAKYERRPSLWIEPIGDWGKGFVELVEIPTDREINDNIVCYWRPAGEVAGMGPWQVSYRMRWTSERLPPADLLWISSSRAGLSFDHERRLFVVDFRKSGDAGNGDFEGLEVKVEASAGEVVNPVIHDAHPNDALRVSFELDVGAEELSELRLVLTRGGKRASETWLYRWTAA